MGLVSFLIKVFFFYIIFQIIMGLFKAWQTYKAIQNQAQNPFGGANGGGAHSYERKSYANEYNSDNGQTIDAEFTVLNEKNSD